MSDEEIRQRLRELIARHYWTFKGATWIPDAEEFMFRFHAKGLPDVEYRCQAHDYQKSKPLSAIRSTWLTFVSSALPAQQPVQL